MAEQDATASSVPRINRKGVRDGNLVSMLISPPNKLTHVAIAIATASTTIDGQ